MDVHADSDIQTESANETWQINHPEKCEELSDESSVKLEEDELIKQENCDYELENGTVTLERIDDSLHTWRCPLCQLKCETKDSLVNHQVSEHGGTHFQQCNVCNESFQLAEQFS